jgi:hypothetical protein
MLFSGSESGDCLTTGGRADTDRFDTLTLGEDGWPFERCVADVDREMVGMGMVELLAGVVLLSLL